MLFLKKAYLEERCLDANIFKQYGGEEEPFHHSAAFANWDCPNETVGMQLCHLMLYNTSGLYLEGLLGKSLYGWSFVK